jgi:hypothetical protein
MKKIIEDFEKQEEISDLVKKEQTRVEFRKDGFTITSSEARFAYRSTAEFDMFALTAMTITHFPNLKEPACIDKIDYSRISLEELQDYQPGLNMRRLYSGNDILTQMIMGNSTITIFGQPNAVIHCDYQPGSSKIRDDSTLTVRSIGDAPVCGESLQYFNYLMQHDVAELASEAAVKAFRNLGVDRVYRQFLGYLRDLTMQDKPSPVEMTLRRYLRR